MMVEAQGVSLMEWEAEYCARETKAVEAILLAQGAEPKRLGVEDTKVVDEVEFANQPGAQVFWDCKVEALTLKGAEEDIRPLVILVSHHQLSGRSEDQL